MVGDEIVSETGLLFHLSYPRSHIKIYYRSPFMTWSSVASVACLFCFEGVMFLGASWTRLGSRCYIVGMFSLSVSELSIVGALEMFQWV